MIHIGKKIISALVEVSEKKEPVTQPEMRVPPEAGMEPGVFVQPEVRTDGRFAGHFDKLLSEANIPGPDYYEFARMIAVMQAIPDEAARYSAAFAGLQAQGLNKERLLDTAGEYLRILATDAAQFQATVDASYREKVHDREMEAEDKAGRIRALSQEIVQLQQQISAMNADIRASREKLVAGSSAYSDESTRRQEDIRRDIEKINQYIH